MREGMELFSRKCISRHKRFTVVGVWVGFGELYCFYQVVGIDYPTF